MCIIVCSFGFICEQLDVDVEFVVGTMRETCRLISSSHAAKKKKKELYEKGNCSSKERLRVYWEGA